MTVTLDEVDCHIFNAPQKNGRTSNADVARELEMAPSAILERIRKLEQRGLITGCEVRLDSRALGLTLTAFCFIKEVGAGGGKGTAEVMAGMPDVMEVHHVAGKDGILVKLRVRDTDHLSGVLEPMKSVPHVAQTRATIVLSTEKESGRVPIPAAIK